LRATSATAQTPTLNMFLILIPPLRLSLQSSPDPVWMIATKVLLALDLGAKLEQRPQSRLPSRKERERQAPVGDAAGFYPGCDGAYKLIFDRVVLHCVWVTGL